MAELKKDTKLPGFMTKGGPGDKDFKMSLLGGKVDTSSWFAEKEMYKERRIGYDPDLLKPGTLSQQAKDQEIFFCDIP